MRQRIELTDEVLEVELACPNSERTLPAALGFHPWFRRDLGQGPVVFDFAPRGRYQPVASGIPGDPGKDLGQRPWDDVFTGLVARRCRAGPVTPG